MTENASPSTIRHFALHRIDGTELRVISDIETGVTSIIEVEEAVLRRYVAEPAWPHHTVSLFVLSDLGPLQRQLARSAKLPPGGIEGLGLRPIVNVYDLANSNACHVFVNQTAMLKEGYWGDRLSETALLAHEHAHPLAENATTRASRQVTIAVQVGFQTSLAQGDDWADKLRRLLQGVLGDAAPQAPCPELALELAGYAAGEIDRSTCERMEAHLSRCPRCSEACESLKSTVKLCSSVEGDQVPAPIKAAVRAALAAQPMS